jgi:hypothetical protein
MLRLLLLRHFLACMHASGWPAEMWGDQQWMQLQQLSDCCCTAAAAAPPAPLTPPPAVTHTFLLALALPTDATALPAPLSSLQRLIVKLGAGSSNLGECA